MASSGNSTTMTQFLTTLITGLKQLQPNGSFTIAGVTYTTAQLVKIFQQIITGLAGVSAAKAAYTKASQSSHALHEQYGVVVLGVKHMLQVQASNDPTVLAAYGLTPQKPTGPKSPEVKVAAADKARATRTARNTIGPKAKLKITGAIAPAASVEPAAPAVSPTSSAPIGATPAGTTGH